MCEEQLTFCCFVERFCETEEPSDLPLHTAQGNRASPAQSWGIACLGKKPREEEEEVKNLGNSLAREKLCVLLL
jgi:hypothetical protein